MSDVTPPGQVLWSMVMRIAFVSFPGYWGAAAIYVIFAFWSVLTISILCLMEGLSAFLHTLRWGVRAEQQKLWEYLLLYSISVLQQCSSSAAEQRYNISALKQYRSAEAQQQV